MKIHHKIGLLLILVAILWPTGASPFASVDTAVVVYESEKGPLPNYVFGAFRQLEEDYDVRAIDDDVTTGLGDQPDHVQEAITAARENGLPALVLTGGGKVIRAMDLPGSMEKILEIVK